VLAVSLVSKLRSATAFRRFRDGLGDLGVPARLGTTAAVAAVLGESVTLGLVVVPATAVIGLFAAGSLFVAFALVLGRAVAQGTAASCHCFGATKDNVSARHVARTGALAVLAYAAGVLDAAAYPWHLFADPPTALVAVAVSAVAVAAVVHLDELTWLFGGSPR
jgi:hypothetical protein